MTQLHKVTSATINRRVVMKGDAVRVKPSPGRKDGFEATFMNADIDSEGRVHCVTVYGGKRAKGIRSYLPERIMTHRKQPAKN